MKRTKLQPRVSPFPVGQRAVGRGGTLAGRSGGGVEREWAVPSEHSAWTHEIAEERDLGVQGTALVIC